MRSQSAKTKNKSFIIQGSILASAGILVRIIGLIYRIPLTRILGEEGAGYYQTAYDIYNVLILLSSQSMPLAVSKIVSEKLGKGEEKNAGKVFRGALIYGIIVGGALGLFAFFGADWLSTTFYKAPEVAMPLRVLAPTVTVACILGVFRGYFQGRNDMVPTSVSQIIEQIVNGCVSVFAAIELVSYGLLVENVTESTESTIIGKYGATGSTLGTFAGALAALAVMFVIYMKHRKSFKEAMLLDNTEKIDSYSHITKLIISTITPVLISTTIYNISNILDNPIFQNIMELYFGMDKQERISQWGFYSSGFRVLTTMPIAIASALSTAMVPSVIRTFVSKDMVGVGKKISAALKFSMIIAFPCGMGLSILGEQFNTILFDFDGPVIRNMMFFSVFTVVFFSLSTISNAILQGVDKLKTPIKNSAIALVIHVILLPVFLIVFDLGIYGVVICDFIFALTVCILNAVSIKKYTGYSHNIGEIILKPFLCSLVMSIACLAVYWTLYYLSQNMFVSVVFAVIAAVVVYGLLIVATGTVTREELEGIPKGSSIIRILEKFRLLK